MQIKVRPENIEDASAIDKVILGAYASVSYSDHTEHIMVHRLRESEAYLPQLSLVAEIADQIVGHIMLTSVVIKDQARSFPSLALAPLSVLPKFQKQGVGTALINQAHERARCLGFASIVVLGIPGYYPKFGYFPLSTYDIKVPFNIREENCLIIPLTPDGLSGVSGLVEYPREWTERQQQYPDFKSQTVSQPVKPMNVKTAMSSVTQPDVIGSGSTAGIDSLSLSLLTADIDDPQRATVTFDALLRILHVTS